MAMPPTVTVWLERVRSVWGLQREKRPKFWQISRRSQCSTLSTQHYRVGVCTTHLEAKRIIHVVDRKARRVCSACTDKLLPMTTRQFGPLQASHQRTRRHKVLHVGKQTFVRIGLVKSFRGLLDLRQEKAGQCFRHPTICGSNLYGVRVSATS